MSTASVTNLVPLRLVPSVISQQLRDSLMQPLEKELATTYLRLSGEEPSIFTARLPDALAADVKYAARVAVNLLDRERTSDALLRARDEVALHAYGAPYLHQKPGVQNRINHIVLRTWTSILVHLQGISQPLHPSQRLALQPEKQAPEVAR